VDNLCGELCGKRLANEFFTNFALDKKRFMLTIMNEGMSVSAHPSRLTNELTQPVSKANSFATTTAMEASTNALSSQVSRLKAFFCLCSIIALLTVDLRGGVRRGEAPAHTGIVCPGAAERQSSARGGKTAKAFTQDYGNFLVL
jgi:hypothetical protein